MPPRRGAFPAVKGNYFWCIHCRHWMSTGSRAFRERLDRGRHPLRHEPETALLPGRCHGGDLLDRLTAGLAACAEKPQRVTRDGDAARASESWDGQLRERTLKQGESDRMSY
jgi:hypothetical protein